jgi:hypothetical protein
VEEKDGTPVYWYNYHVRNAEYPLIMSETQYFNKMKIGHDPYVPQNYYKAMCGSIKSPRQTSLAFLEPSDLITKVHIIGTRCCLSYGTISKHKFFPNFDNSLSLGSHHSGKRIALL